VFLDNAERVTFVAKPAGGSTTAVTVAIGADVTAELSTNPGGQVGQMGQVPEKEQPRRP